VTVFTLYPPPAGCSFEQFFVVGLLLFVGVGRSSLQEHFVRRFAFHVPSLMRPLPVVVKQVGIQIGLHFLQRLIPLGSTLNAEVLVQQGKVQALD